MKDKRKGSINNGMIIFIVVAAIVVQSIIGLATGVYVTSKIMYRVRENIMLSRHYNDPDYDTNYDDDDYDDYDDDATDDIAPYSYTRIEQSAIAAEDLLGTMEINEVYEPCYLVKKEAYEKYQAYSNVAYENNNQINAETMDFYCNPEFLMKMYQSSDSYYIRIVSTNKETTANLWFYFLRHSIPDVSVRITWDDDAFMSESEMMDYTTSDKNEAPIGYRDSNITFQALQKDEEGAEWGMLGWIK